MVFEEFLKSTNNESQFSFHDNIVLREDIETRKFANAQFFLIVDLHELFIFYFIVISVVVPLIVDVGGTSLLLLFFLNASFFQGSVHLLFAIIELVQNLLVCAYAALDPRMLRDLYNGWSLAGDVG